MKLIVRAVALLTLILPVGMAGALILVSQAQGVPEIGGQKVVTLTRTAISTTKPEFTSITVLPGRGMEVLQITANFPGKGNVDMLTSPDLATAAKTLDEQDNELGGKSVTMGAAFLIPYPNRVRGKLSEDGKTLTTEWQGHSIVLPVGAPRRPGAEVFAMHGLISKAKTSEVKVNKVADGEEVTGVIEAGDFGGHWLSKTRLSITIRLAGDAVDASVVARNVGKEPEPMAIGWHPYFNLPSGDRTQARLSVPGSTVAEVESNGNIPTGKLLPVDGTKFDLRSSGGTVLAGTSFDDNWSHLDRKGGAATVQVIDPAAHYGVSIEGLSPEIKTIQVFAPAARNFVAVEHQYNFVDPFDSQWGSMDTGMVTLKPGKSTEWHVRLRVLVP
jgi:galactose mutarotase-like enzyme